VRTDRSDTSAIRRILTTLVDQQRRLRSAGAPAAEVEANRKAIAYWHTARTAVRAEAPRRVDDTR
jgi:hypothetical protein